MLPIWQVVLSVLLCTVWFVTYFSPRRRRMRELAARIPGPTAWPLVGNALNFMVKTEDQLNIIARYFETYGECVRFWLGPDLNICIKNPADIRLVLTSNKVNQKGVLYNVLLPYIGPGILSGGPTWRNHRKIATPNYSKKSVRLYTQVFNEQAELLALSLSSKNAAVTFDVYRDVVHMTTQCVCQTLMGLSKEDLKSVKRMDELVFLTQTIYTFMFTQVTHWWFQIPLVSWLAGRNKIEDGYLKLIDDVASDIIAKRRRALEKNPEIDEEIMGIVDRYILSGDLTEKEIKWETFTVFTTSQEAAAKIASAVLLFLAHLPEWQEKVYKEILEVFGPDEPVSYDQLKKLEALDMVFKEACRYLAIAAFIQRTVEEETTITDGKQILPVGASVIIPIHMLHRDPQHWTDPDKVDPGRFLPEHVRGRDPNIFMPFSLGAMDCLGRVYANTLIKTLVVYVIRRVELEADGNLEDLALDVAISVKFTNGYNLRAKPRSWQMA